MNSSRVRLGGGIDGRYGVVFSCCLYIICRGGYVILDLRICLE